MTRNSADTAKVKRWKVNVTRSCGIYAKTSNICRKRHPIVDIYPYYRKSLSLKTMMTAVFRPEVELTQFLHAHK